MTEEIAYDQSMKYYRDLKNVIDKSYDDGKIEGELKGEFKGKKDLLLRILNKKFKSISSDLENTINSLQDIKIIENIIDNIFDLESVKDIEDIINSEV